MIRWFRSVIFVKVLEVQVLNRVGQMKRFRLDSDALCLLSVLRLFALCFEAFCSLFRGFLLSVLRLFCSLFCVFRLVLKKLKKFMNALRWLVLGDETCTFAILPFAARLSITFCQVCQ